MWNIKNKGIIGGILICLIIFIFLFSTKASFPEKILIQVSNPDDKIELNADCKADFYDEGEKIIEKRKLNLDKAGYYQLDTSELKNYKDFEIIITCSKLNIQSLTNKITMDTFTKDIGKLIINSGNMPCEVEKDYLVCPM
jgi:hypothetical protein